MKKFVLIFLLLLVGPIAVSTANYLLGVRRDNWQTADRSSAGLLPKPAEHPEALIRVFAARTVRWRGIFAVHTWIVVKERGSARYSRYDYTAWGEPIRIDGFAPDGRWFGATPETVVSVLREMRSAGKGIVGMKILGQGDLSGRQNEALKYALSLGLLDSFTIGAESKKQQDDLIRRIGAAA